VRIGIVVSNASKFAGPIPKMATVLAHLPCDQHEHCAPPLSRRPQFHRRECDAGAGSNAIAASAGSYSERNSCPCAERIPIPTHCLPNA